MKSLFACLAAGFLVACFSMAFSQINDQKLARMIGESDLLSGHFTGLVIADAASGQVLGAYQEDKYFTRSEEHTSELQSLMRISYAVFCLKKKKSKTANNNQEKIIQMLT